MQARIEDRIRQTLAQGMVPGHKFARLIRQLKIVASMTGETVDQVAERLS